MTTFLLNSLGRDRPRSDPLFIKIYAMDSCRVDSVRLLVCYRPLASMLGQLATIGFCSLAHSVRDSVVLEATICKDTCRTQLC